MQIIIDIIVPLFIGITLGLLGGGGTVLAVPALVYVFGFDAKTAIALSLLVIGISSLLASLSHIYRKHVNLFCTLVFGLSGSLSSYLSARFIAPQLSNDLQLLLFASLVLTVALLMFKSKPQRNDSLSSVSLPKKCIVSSISGLAIGVITGIIGVGGGFLIVPALIYLMNLSVIEAVGSSLLIIGLQSLAAFLAYSQYLDLPFNFALKFTMCLVLGSFLGTFLGIKTKQEILKKIFAILLLLIGIFIIVEKLYFEVS
jgi:uncharacterized membrane protein YfcA